MPEQPLIVIGASARAAAFSALRAGLQPWCIDLFADADLQSRCPVTRIDFRSYPEDFDQLIRRAPAGPWVYTGGLENYPQLIDRNAAERPLWGNGAHVLRAVRHPLRLFHAFRESGVPSPETRREPPKADSNCRWLVKPLAGAGGSGIRFWTPADTRGSRRTYFQQFIPGKPVAAAYVGLERRSLLLGVTRQLVGEPWLNAKPFQYCGSIGPLPMSETVRQQFERIGEILVSRFRLRGLFGMDAVMHNDVPYPVEVNPRYTASMEVLEYATGLQVFDRHRRAFEAHANSARDRADEMISRDRGDIVGKAILFASREFVFPGMHPTRSLSPLPIAPNRMPAFADIPEPGTTIQSGWPVLTCFAEGQSTDEVADRLRAIISSGVCK